MLYQSQMLQFYMLPHKQKFRNLRVGTLQGNDLAFVKNMYMSLTLWLLMSYIYGAPSKARNANVVYIWTYVWQR